MARVWPPLCKLCTIAADVRENAAEHAKTNAFLPLRHKEIKEIPLNRRNLYYRLLHLMRKMLQKLRKLQMQGVVLTADLREQGAETSENSSDSSDSERLLAVSNWLLAPENKSDMSEMSSQWSSVAQTTAK